MSVPLSAAIVGGGFAGVGTAIKLRQAGIEDIVVFERAERIGGVWQRNTYPGIACDVPSHLYSYSFARNPAWTKRYSDGAEIRDYVQACAERFGVADLIRTGVAVESAVWDEQRALWRLTTSAGEHEARMLITACGQLTEPSIPSIPGLERFAGPAFHSADWRDDVDLDGVRVAVVGTGASAIQFVPRIAPKVKALHVFQRSAPWILPKPDRVYGPLDHRLFDAVPARQLAGRLANFALFESAVPGFGPRPGALKPLELLGSALLRRQVPDPELRERLRPRDRVGCKRTLVSNEWYPTFNLPHVELVADRITEVTDTAVVSADGSAREVDAIIFGTGFDSNGFVAPMAISGRSGRKLSDVWDPIPHAYLGTSVAGFPNLFMVYGPNTGMGVGSAIHMLESQIEHIGQAARLLARTRARSIEVRQQAQDEYNAMLRERLAGSVWESGCASWYIDDQGHDTTNWPGRMSEFRRRSARVDLAAYALQLAPKPAIVA